MPDSTQPKTFDPSKTTDERNAQYGGGRDNNKISQPGQRPDQPGKYNPSQKTNPRTDEDEEEAG